MLACAHAPKPLPDASSAPDRSDADRAMDPGRKPSEFLRFLGVKPGMKVGELMAGGGYTTELLARTVGKEGKIYAENPKWVLDRFAAKPWSDRLEKAVMQNVIREDRELDEGFAPDVENLDLVVSNAIYHDAVWSGADRAKMNAGVARALKSGGLYVVCDSSAVAGHGVADAQTLHRIDEQVVRDEVPKAGFSLVEEGDFLRNPSDARDWSASPSAAGEKRGTSDRFCLKFRKSS